MKVENDFRTKVTGRRRAALLCALLPALAPAAEPGVPLRIAIGETKAPYVLAEEQRGVEYELVSTALRAAGYQPQMLFAPNKRAQGWLAEGRIDAAIANDGGFVSRPYIAYKNMAITLCSRHIELNGVADLGRYRVAAFQNAQRFLGPDYAAMAAGNPNYVEQSPQIAVNRLLYSGRTDVAVADINIFQQFNDELGPGLDAQQALCPYTLFPPTLYRLAFRDKPARDRFDKALGLLAQQGFYETLAKRYGLPAPQGKPSFKPPAR